MERGVNYSNHFGIGSEISGWLPTPPMIVAEALKLAHIGRRDLVFDLGCGDGRVIIQAARMFGARAVGFDVDPSLVRLTRTRITRLGIGHLAHVRRQDMRAIPDLHRASVVFLYLPRSALKCVKPVLLNGCSEGTRIVSVSNDVFNWRPNKQRVVKCAQMRWWIGVWRI
jgi:ribosomal protein L11 methylase PrmA